MSAPLPLSEKRGFYLFFLILIISLFLMAVWASPTPLTISIILLSLFGFFRLTYLFDLKENTLPKAMTLPSRLLFGLDQSEHKIKEKIWFSLTHKTILFWLILGLCFMTWAIFCSFQNPNLLLITPFFKDDIPPIESLSYFNIYEVMQSLIYISFLGLVFLLSLSFGFSIQGIKKPFYGFFVLFVVLFIWIITQSHLTFSLPPFYALWIQGLGLGKSDMLATYQAELFIVPPTGLFKRYLETGLIGVILIYAMQFLVIFMAFQSVHKNGVSQWAVTISLIMVCFFVVDTFLISSPALTIFHFTGFVLSGWALGALLMNKNT